jgi:hypothetical protein
VEKDLCSVLYIYTGRACNRAWLCTEDRSSPAVYGLNKSSKFIVQVLQTAFGGGNLSANAIRFWRGNLITAGRYIG